MIRSCWSMWAPQSRFVYLAVTQSTGSSTWGGRKPSLRHCSYSMSWTNTVECPGVTTISDSAEWCFFWCDAGCPWPPAVSDRRDATRDAILPSGGEPADYRLPAAPLMSRPATSSQHAGDIDTVRARVNVPDLSREGPFDIHQGHQHSGASPRLRQDNQGCPF